MKNLNHWVLWGAMMLIGAISSFAQGENKKLFIRESDFVMGQDQAWKFSDEVLGPMLTEFVNGQEEPQALRNRLNTLVQMIRREEITYLAAPAYFPNRQLHVLAKVEQFQSKRLLMTFIPEFMDLRSQLPSRDFRYALLITLGHEMIHIELGHDKHPEKEAAKDEAFAWFKTIIEIIRPLEAKGIAVPQFSRLSTLLKSLNDNYADPRWLKTFPR